MKTECARADVDLSSAADPLSFASPGSQDAHPVHHHPELLVIVVR